MLFNFTISKFNKILFIALCFLFLTNTSINCKVVYTLIDSTLAGRDFMDAKQFWIDFNSDSTDEFFLSHANQGMGEISYVCEIYSGTNQNSNEVIVCNNNRTPVMLNEGDIISDNLTGWYNSYNGMSTMAMYFENEWLDAGFRFVALRFKINDKYHYGWVRVSVPSDLSNIIVKDMAWDDNPETAITTNEPNSIINDDIFGYKPSVVLVGNSLFIESEKYFSCEIYTLIGNKVKDFNVIVGSSLVELKSLTTGIYFIILKSGNEIITKKIVIN
ncbi:MAG: T9SS type A sorting domain-containing protein [bacterium]